VRQLFTAHHPKEATDDHVYAALAVGYSVSVAENNKQRIWKPQVRAEFERLLHIRVSVLDIKQDGPHNQVNSSLAIEAEVVESDEVTG
jgi:hypothetical protein